MLILIIIEIVYRRLVGYKMHICNTYQGTICTCACVKTFSMYSMRCIFVLLHIHVNIHVHICTYIQLVFISFVFIKQFCTCTAIPWSFQRIPILHMQSQSKITRMLDMQFLVLLHAYNIHRYSVCVQRICIASKRVLCRIIVLACGCLEWPPPRTDTYWKLTFNSKQFTCTLQTCFMLFSFE